MSDYIYTTSRSNDIRTYLPTFVLLAIVQHLPFLSDRHRTINSCEGCCHPSSYIPRFLIMLRRFIYLKLKIYDLKIIVKRFIARER